MEGDFHAKPDTNIMLGNWYCEFPFLIVPKIPFFFSFFLYISHTLTPPPLSFLLFLLIIRFHSYLTTSPPSSF
ncbi:hypothetical protein RIF29_37971 [Crotalaria pallida]|uniref:Uncharacterized protein n=1 Tax=Crotalaria pallida TaxID=3830 RepID=A0AAN9HP79_CROPI